MIITLLFCPSKCLESLANSIKNSDSPNKYSFIESANVILLPGSPKTNRPTRKTLKSERDNWQHSRGTTFWYNTWLESSSSSSSVEEEKKPSQNATVFTPFEVEPPDEPRAGKGPPIIENILWPLSHSHPWTCSNNSRYDIASHKWGWWNIRSQSELPGERKAEKYCLLRSGRIFRRAALFQWNNTLLYAGSCIFF